MNKVKNILFVLVLAVVLYSCSTDGNNTGREYMPDMAHSIAVEANVYNDYWANTWDKESVLSLKELSAPRAGVKGTVPRGKMASEEGKHNAIAVSDVNSSMPYHYSDTDAERERAIAEITKNPLPITAAGLAEGKELYNVFCGVCHGSGGQFKDGIYASGIYPAAPANLVNAEFTGASPGRYYHAIMHGKNVMGSYKDKLSYEERWNVIHYIRSLQAKEQKAKYSEETNTLNSYATPGAQWKEMTHHVEEVHDEAHSDDHGHDEGEHAHDADGHDQDHGHSGGHH